MPMGVGMKHAALILALLAAAILGGAAFGLVLSYLGPHLPA
jgi:hypothetical protein